jgi:hypothetical protein
LLDYQGEAPFSAPEARALADWTLKLHRTGHGKIIGFLDFHSYSQQGKKKKTPSILLTCSIAVR